MLKEKILRLFPAFALAFVVATSGVSSQAAATAVASAAAATTATATAAAATAAMEAAESAATETALVNTSNPKPDGGSTGLVDAKSLIEEAMKNGGAELVYENNFLQTTLGQTLIKNSKTGSIVPFHNPDPLANSLVVDPLGNDPFEQEANQGGSSGGGWYDPMGGSMLEQMIKAGKKNKGKGKGNKGSGDAGSDALNPGYEFSADPALVNPVPVQLPVAKPRNTTVQHLHVPARAQTQKGKRTIGKTAKIYPTIPNLPSPTAATNQSAAVGNLRAMRGRIRIGLRPISVRTIRLR
jgi:hypothetical protein